MTNKQRIIDDFTRVLAGDGVTVLEVGLVRWTGPHTPEMEWKHFHKWQRPPTRDQLSRAVERALASPRFFGVCEKCGELRNRGHMHSLTVCQGCSGAIH